MIRACRVCGLALDAGDRGGGRCGACYLYWWRHGTERLREPPRCVVCGWPAAYQHLCRPCYMRAWRRGWMGQRYRAAPAGVA